MKGNYTIIYENSPDRTSIYILDIVPGKWQENYAHSHYQDWLGYMDIQGSSFGDQWGSETIHTRDATKDKKIVTTKFHLGET